MRLGNICFVDALLSTALPLYPSGYWSVFICDRGNICNRATILVSSHNLQHTVDISGRIVLLEHGKVIQDIDNKEKQAQTILENYFEIDD